MSYTRIPPHHIQSEQSVLGALMLDNEAFDRIGDKLNAKDFYRAEHQQIFVAITSLILANKPADVLTVHEALESSGEAAHIGGLAYLGEIANNTPSSASIVRYAEIVREQSILRNLASAGDEIAGMAHEVGNETPMERVNRASARLNDIADGGTVKNEPQTLLEASQQAVVDIQKRYEGDQSASYKTGLTDLDVLLASYLPGEMIVVAGRPGMGKTTLADQMAQYVEQDNKPGAVVFFSLEMPAKQLARRRMSRTGKLRMDQLSNPSEHNMTHDDFDRLSYAMAKASESPLIIDDTSAIDPVTMRTRLNRIVRKHGGVKLIVIDYLQLMTLGRHHRGAPENRVQEIAQISAAVKAIAKDYKCPVIALSQLSRKCEERPNKRPMMSDLRESGAIEQDAGLILFVYRDEVYNPDTTTEKGIAEIGIGKQRDGTSGAWVPVAFRGEYNMFADLDKQEYYSRKNQEDAQPKQKVRGFK